MLINTVNKNRILRLFNIYSENSNYDIKKLHHAILNNFVNNPYCRNSNSEIDYIWTLYHGYTK